MPDTTRSEISLRGPLFEGDHGASKGLEVAAGCSTRIARFVLERVQSNLDMSIKDPTPYYETQITITNTSLTDRSVNDRGVIYGPWLEGVSSRNQATRFKGYWAFRTAAEETRGRVNSLCGVVIKKFINDMNSYRGTGIGGF